MPLLRKVDRCKACEAPIVWAVTKAGKRMPVDVTPTEDGNVLLFPMADRQVLAIVFSLDEARAKSRERFKSHFATCVEAARFRRDRRGGS